MSDLWIESEALLEEHGWELECYSPLEIRSKDGESFATNRAADIVMEYFRKESLHTKRKIYRSVKRNK